MTVRIEQVAIGDLDLRLAALRLVAPVEEARLQASVAREGIRHPVVAATEVEPGRRVLVDGFKRVRVAGALRIAVVWTTLVALDGPAAKAAMVRCNARHRGLTEVEQGWIAQSLCREHALTQEKAGVLLGHDKSWVCRLLKLVEQLDPALQEDLRLGLLAAAVARELSRLPRGNQLRAARVVREHGLSCHQVAALVQVLLATPEPHLRQEVLRDPRRHLPAVKSAARPAADPQLSAAGNELRRRLLSFEAAAWRVAQSLQQHAPAGLEGQDGLRLAPLGAGALVAGRQVVDALQHWLPDRGVRAEDQGRHGEA